MVYLWTFIIFIPNIVMIINGNKQDIEIIFNNLF